MGYLDTTRAADGTAIQEILKGAAGIASFPASAAPGNGVSMAEVLRSIWDATQGAAGIATYPAAAAPANAVSLAEVMAACYGLLVPTTVTGTATVTDASQTETTPFAILTIAPAAGAPLASCDVIFDLAKASTGFAAIETSITVQLAVSRKIDGTNWRREAYVEAALSGTLAALRAMKLQAGNVGVTEQVRIEAVFSSDVTTNIVIPYVVMYKAIAAPTLS